MPSIDWPNHLAAKASAAPTATALFETALDHLPCVTAAPIRMLLPCHPPAPGHPPESASTGLRAVHIDEYLRLWRDRDPVRKAAQDRRVAVKESDLAGYASSGFCAGFAARVRAASYMVAPLYGYAGAVTHTLHLGRYEGMRAFADADATQVTAFAAFLSVMLARLPGQATGGPGLAPREHQIALLAASGRSNGDIAHELGIARETVKQTLRRVYRKVSVTNRTELAAYCARAGLL